MSLTISIYGSTDANLEIDELIEILEEAEFEVTVEEEEEREDDSDPWTDLLVFEASIDGPISLSRLDGSGEQEKEVAGLLSALREVKKCRETKYISNLLENLAIGFTIEVPEEMAEDDNALLLASLLAQILAQKSDGIYCVDGEGFFDESGDLILELADSND